MGMRSEGLEALRRQLTAQDIQKLEEDCAKELAARLLRDVVKNTPVGLYPQESGKKGGSLRRKWSISSPKLQQGKCTIEVINPMEYASYVEYGHRQEPGRFVPVLGKRLKASWVDGRFMLTRAEDRLRQNAQAIVDKKVNQYMEGMLNGK